MPAIVATMREIAAAMAYLHAQGILHGDLTGANVLLSSGLAGGGGGGGAAPGADSGDANSGPAAAGGRGFVAKVGDFGFARVLGGGGDASVSTGTYGTVTHCPPELLTTGRLSKAADVYAFGVLCWECYTGRRPWEGERE
jgi:serine/threonine protein kinase